jgi:hypothetical protein
MYGLDAPQNDACATKALEAHHWAGSTFDGPVILFDNVVQILFLADLDRRFPSGVDRLQGSQILSALIDRYGLGVAILVNCFFEISPGRSLVPSGSKQKINGVYRLVDSPVEIPPLTPDPNVGLVHPPALADRPFAPSKRLLQDRQQLERPTMNRRMIDRNPALGHHLLKMTLGSADMPHTTGRRATSRPADNATVSALLTPPDSASGSSIMSRIQGRSE